MKILIDARLYGLENTGLGRYIINLVGELTKTDNKNTYVILLVKKYYELLELPSNWRKVEANFRHYSLAEQFKLPGIIKKEKPDIIHFPHFNVPLFFNGKFVVTIHDMLMHKSVGLASTTLPAPVYFIKRLGYRLVFDHAIKGSVRILVPSRAVREEIINKYRIEPNKIVVTYEGFDSNISNKFDNKISKSNLDLGKPYFSYIGNAYPHKNIGNLIKAIKLLNTKSNQKIILAISSARNIFTQRLEIMIKNEKAENLVKILDFLPDDKLGSLLHNSVGFVFPSLSEGFGLPGLEALSAGTLLLASNIPVLKEIYQDHAIYFDPRDVKSISNALEESLRIDPTDREKMVEKGKEFVNIYSWSKMAKETLKIYEESCNNLSQSENKSSET